MKINKLLIIEDSPFKFDDVRREIEDRYHITNIWHAEDSETAVRLVEGAAANDEPFDLIISDMFFPLKGWIHPDAGIKTREILKEKGIDIPTIYCSTAHLTLKDCIGCVHYGKNRDWESELAECMKIVKGMQQ